MHEQVFFGNGDCVGMQSILKRSYKPLRCIRRESFYFFFNMLDIWAKFMQLVNRVFHHLCFLFSLKYSEIFPRNVRLAVQSALKQPKQNDVLLDCVTDVHIYNANWPWHKKQMNASIPVCLWLRVFLPCVLNQYQSSTRGQTLVQNWRWE